MSGDARADGRRRSDARGWTGDWELPGALGRPQSEAERRALVRLACSGAGPGAIVRRVAGRRSVLDVAPPDAPDECAARLDGLGVRAVVPGDAEYPAPLRAIKAPPPLLFVRGRSIASLQPGVAIVGARACTQPAARFAARLADAFAAAGFCVISGLARGIDAAAHEGALDVGATMAVLGTGIDAVYPPEHRGLAARIADAGALVTEFPPGVGPRPWHFPARNRIIAGLAIAVVVVEAGAASGALITAEFAEAEGREVLACTTAPETPSGAGVRALLRDGARLVVDDEDTTKELVELAHAQGWTLTPRRAGACGAIERPPGDLGRVWDAVGVGTTVDEVVTATRMHAGRVAALLGALELDGLLRATGGRWSRR